MVSPALRAPQSRTPERSHAVEGHSPLVPPALLSARKSPARRHRERARYLRPASGLLLRGLPEELGLLAASRQRHPVIRRVRLGLRRAQSGQRRLFVDLHDASSSAGANDSKCGGWCLGVRPLERTTPSAAAGASGFVRWSERLQVRRLDARLRNALQHVVVSSRPASPGGPIEGDLPSCAGFSASARPRLCWSCSPLTPPPPMPQERRFYTSTTTTPRTTRSMRSSSAATARWSNSPARPSTPASTA